MSGSYLAFSAMHDVPEAMNSTGLVSEIRRFLEDELDDSSLNVESDSTEEHGYFSIDQEGQFHEETWRLVVRAYAADTDAHVEVLTEVIGDDGKIRDTQYPEVRGAIPRFVSRLAERYICTSQSHRIGETPTLQSLCEFKGFLFDKGRRLPVLLISRSSDGGYPFGSPKDLIERLSGRVLVVCAPQDNRLREFGYRFNIRNGSSRIIWPGASQDNVGGASGYFPAGTSRTAQRFAAQILKTIDENSELAGAVESIRSEFEFGYMASRMHCLERKNAEYLRQSRDDEGQDSSNVNRELTRERRKARKAEERLGWQTERAENTARKLSDVEALLDTAKRDIQRLEQERDTALGKGAADSERRSRGAIARLERELERVRSESMQLRSRAETGAASASDDSKRFTLWPTDKNPQQLTILNHAFNLMRDPSRHYIMERLSRQHEKDEIEFRLSRCVRLETDSARRKLQYDPKSLIDINDFERIVSANLECFEGNTGLLRKLAQIREQRNRVVHPDYNTSANRGMAIKTLDDIAETLEIMMANRESKEVLKLKAAL